ncbi:PucR family transcriptional regulator [Microbacterium sp. NPDC055357]
MPAVAPAPTVRALLASGDLQLTLITEADSPAALDREVRWVHSSDLADPTPFLSEGLVLLTTGTQFQGEDATTPGAYVQRLASRSVAGLGFGTAVVRDGIPPDLSDACRAAGIPLFEVPYRTPFIAIARANAEAIAAQTFERRSWALAAQRAISLAALRPDGLDRTLAELARQLETWVGLFDAAGELVREHPAALDAETAASLRDEVDIVLRRAARAGSALQIGATAFTLQTLGRGGSLRGVIAIAAGGLDHEGRGVVTAVIAMAGLALEQHDGLARARNALRAGLIQILLTGDPALARRIAHELWGPLPTAPVLVAIADAVDSGAAGLTDFLELRIDERRGSVFFGGSDDGLVIVVPADDRRILDDVVARFDTQLGVSDPVGYDAFHSALEQARVARARGRGPLTDFADVAPAGVLSALSADAHVLAAAELAPLTDHDTEEGTRLVETLAAWLDNDCSHEASARALGVHRHTIRTRLGVIEQILGRDLTSFATRAELWAALRVRGG